MQLLARETIDAILEKSKARFRELTTRDHAVCWGAESGKDVPDYGAPEWNDFYQSWIDFAFADFGKKTVNKKRRAA